MTQAVPGLEVVRAQTDADLEVMIAVRTAADPDRPPPRLENLRHNLAANETLVYVIARLDGEPAGCGFVDPWPDELAPAHLVVVPALRRRGIGSALLAELGRRALEAGRPELEGEVVESDIESQDVPRASWLSRRGRREGRRARSHGARARAGAGAAGSRDRRARRPSGACGSAVRGRRRSRGRHPGQSGRHELRAVARDRARSADAAARPAVRGGRGRGAGRICLDGRRRPRRLQRTDCRSARMAPARHRHGAEADADRRREASPASSASSRAAKSGTCPCGR